jgi:micrococcal nuclease
MLCNLLGRFDFASINFQINKKEFIVKYAILYSILLIFSLSCSRLYDPYETAKVVIEPTLHDELFVFTVTEILDGESIKVHSLGQNYTILLSGIEIPETTCMEIEKEERIKTLLLGKKVAIESDNIKKDSSTILSRYVWLTDGNMINETLIREGFAKLNPNIGEFKYKERLLLAQNLAFEDNLGIWQICKNN